MLNDLSVNHHGGTDTPSLRDRVLLLETLVQDGSIDLETITQVAEHVRPRRFLAGELLLRDNEEIENIYLLSRGKVTVTQQGRTVRVFDGEGPVGLNAVVAGVESGVQALADTDADTLELPANILMNLYESNFGLVRRSLRFLSGQVLESRSMLPTHEGDKADIGVWREKARTFVETVIELRRSPFYMETNLDAVMEVARQGREVRGAAGDVLWRAGDGADYWITVDYGRMRCTSEAGESVTVGSNYTLGVMDAMAVQPRGYTVEAISDYIGFRLDRDTMLAVLEAHFDLSRRILASMSDMVFRLPAK